MTPTLEGLPTKAKEAPFPREVRLALLDTNPVFQCLGEIFQYSQGSLTVAIFFFLCHLSK